MQPLRILFLWEGIDVGGAERYLIAKVRWFRARGHHVWVASAGGSLLNEILATGAQHLLLPSVGQRVASPGLLDAANDWSRLDELVEREQIELIDAVAVKPFLYAAPVRRRRKIPLVLEALSPCHLVPPVAREEIASVFADGNVVAMEGSWGHAYAAYGIDTRGLRVIPNSVDTNVFRPPSPNERAAARAALGIGDGEHLLLSVSRLDADKAPYVLRLIEEFRAISACDPAARLIIAGDGTEATRLRERAHAAHGDRARRIIGTSRTDEIVGWYAAADIFFGMGTTVIEAAACGAPVIVANQYFMTPGQMPGIDAAASGVFGQDGYAGIGSPGPRVTSFTERALELLADSAHRHNVAVEALHLVREHFSTEAVMRQWEEFFESRVYRHATSRADLSRDIVDVAVMPDSHATAGTSIVSPIVVAS
ncbi:MAG: glycosyltransferase family 4 protein [bacterium]